MKRLEKLFAKAILFTLLGIASLYITLAVDKIVAATLFAVVTGLYIVTVVDIIKRINPKLKALKRLRAYELTVYEKLDVKYNNK